MPSRDREGAVNESWAEEPLRSQKPCYCDQSVASKASDVVGLFLGGWWVCGVLQEGEGESGPEPADLDEVDVEDVVLAGEVVGGG